MTVPRKRRSKGMTKEQIFGTPADAARVRIAMCEEFGMTPDPGDVELAKDKATNPNRKIR